MFYRKFSLPSCSFAHVKVKVVLVKSTAAEHARGHEAIAAVVP